ncbi:MAG: glycosyltransferase [Actinomycetota bacterium]|nr:glycosyltransferase [Actinomycetota bacterium]MDQ2955679.1 glycosyltransferase [Actinomycetota bacterium]
MISRSSSTLRSSDTLRNSGKHSVEVNAPYQVQYRRIHRSRWQFALTIVVAFVSVGIELGLLGWLLQPAHWPVLEGKSRFVVAATLFFVAAITVMELMRLISATSLSLAGVVGRDPITVEPAAGMRVALLTTIVPSREPLDIIERTLRAALRVRHCDPIEVWLLDEGNDEAARALCQRLGVHHFSRFGKPEYNTKGGRFAAKTKHGNLNSWLDQHGADYDVLLCVDPDHVPEAHFAERVLGYFRDPDVAFVVGPQFYGNPHTLVTRGAESQQFPFHSLIQRAANRYHAPMLVGTNNAIRISSLTMIGGLSDSITEDLATGLRIHTTRNPATGRRWRSVYVTDLLAVGQGPESWGDFFTQQFRWSRGGFQVIGRHFLRTFFRLTPGRLFHYLLITSCYPAMALGWLLGAANATLCLGFAPAGLNVPVQLWTVLYLNATAFQMWVYIRSRDMNISPFEDVESPGLLGAVMSIVTLPIYGMSLLNALAFRRGRFVVTPKGSASLSDSLGTFRYQLGWAALYTVGILASVKLHHTSIYLLIWPLLALLVCLLPLIMWRWDLRQRRQSASAPRPIDGAGLADELDDVRRFAGRHLRATVLAAAGETTADGVAS